MCFVEKQKKKNAQNAPKKVNTCENRSKRKREGTQLIFIRDGFIRF